MIDLTAPFGPSHIEQSTKAWPKCGRCSARLRRPYPVEVLGLVGRERSKDLHGKYVLILEAECHGDKQTGALAIPDWYSEGKEIELMSKAVFFNRKANAIGRRENTITFVDLIGMTRHGS